MDFETQLKTLEVTAEFLQDDGECDALEADLNRFVPLLSNSTNPPQDWRNRITMLRQKIEKFRIDYGSQNNP